jgi:benzoyl-CoA 2,3-dioxygenase component B
MMVDALVEGEIGELEVSALTGLNTDLRRQYINDCRGPAVAASRRSGS